MYSVSTPILDKPKRCYKLTTLISHGTLHCVSCLLLQTINTPFRAPNFFPVECYRLTETPPNLRAAAKITGHGTRPRSSLLIRSGLQYVKELRQSLSTGIAPLFYCYIAPALHRPTFGPRFRPKLCPCAVTIRAASVTGCPARLNCVRRLLLFKRALQYLFSLIG